MNAIEFSNKSRMILNLTLNSVYVDFIQFDFLIPYLVAHPMNRKWVSSPQWLTWDFCRVNPLKSLGWTNPQKRFVGSSPPSIYIYTVYIIYPDIYRWFSQLETSIYGWDFPINYGTIFPHQVRVSASFIPNLASSRELGSAGPVFVRWMWVKMEDLYVGPHKVVPPR